MLKVTQQINARAGTSSGFLILFLGYFPYSLSPGNLEPSHYLELSLWRGLEWPTWAGPVWFRGLARGLCIVAKTKMTAERMGIYGLWNGVSSPKLLE